MSRIALVLISLAAAGSVFADDSAAATTGGQGKQAPNFAQVQKRALARIDEGIKRLEDARDCVAAATDMASLKACKPAKKADSGNAKANDSIDQ